MRIRARRRAVIVVEEGPTESGKTTWAMTNAGDVLLPEAIPTAAPPRDARAAARFWADNGAAR